MKKHLRIIYFTVSFLLLRTIPVRAAYVDPSVMTYAIQSIAGLLIGLGTFFSVYWRRIAGSFRDDSLKEVESDNLKFTPPDGEAQVLEFTETEKKHTRKKAPWLLTSVILSGAMSFMLGVYKPLQVLFTNLSEFSFEFWSIIPYILILFVIIWIAELAVHIICGLISEKLVYLSIIVASVCYFAFYIQGNFLVKNLPAADGGSIDWGQFQTDNLQSILLWVGLTVLFAAAAHFLKEKGFMALTRILVSSVTVVLSVLLIVIGVKNGGFTNHASLRITTEGLNEFSGDRNFVILIPDCVDSRAFSRVMEKADSDVAAVLEDFTYYPDTMSVFPHTSFSIPQMITGEKYKLDQKFADFYNNAVDHSRLLNTVVNEGYELTAYDDGEMQHGSHPEQYRNLAEKGFEFADSKAVVMDLLRMIFFYHMPYQLKKYEPYALYNLTHETEKDVYSWRDNEFYEWLCKNPDVTVEKKQFRIVHFEGAHPPFRYTKELDDIIGTGKASYEGDIEAVVTVLGQFLQNMKDEGVYDNSVILIMADHGYNNDEDPGKQNPLFAVKGYNEKHPFAVSDIPVTYDDLQEIYQNLLADKTGEDAVKTANPSGIRTYYFYAYGPNYTVEEQTTDGHAWETEKLTPTGTVYGPASEN